MRPNENPTGESKTRLGSNRFVARHTKNTRRSREVSPRRLQLFCPRHRPAGWSSQDRWSHGVLTILLMTQHSPAAVMAPQDHWESRLCEIVMAEGNAKFKRRIAKGQGCPGAHARHRRKT